ncbi:YfbM family protein [Spirillospora sp. CA-294931]|uniref:YfbM family protein n=1 Tax=Spirillospora sp. CA-294931 TaxID=3240042 RepID=UPI003D947936
MSLGVHFALTAGQEERLLAATDLADLIEEIEEAWSSICETDKAWDAIDRCLRGAGYPLSHAVLGGRHLQDDGEHIVSYVTAAEVKDVARELASVDEPWLRARYSEIDAADYEQHGDDDFTYTWNNFARLRAFYTEAAAAGRAVIFTT